MRDRREVPSNKEYADFALDNELRTIFTTSVELGEALLKEETIKGKGSRPSKALWQSVLDLRDHVSSLHGRDIMYFYWFYRALFYLGTTNVLSLPATDIPTPYPPKEVAEVIIFIIFKEELTSLYNSAQSMMQFIRDKHADAAEFINSTVATLNKDESFVLERFMYALIKETQTLISGNFIEATRNKSLLDSKRIATDWYEERKKEASIGKKASKLPDINAQPVESPAPVKPTALLDTTPTATEDNRLELILEELRVIRSQLDAADSFYADLADRFTGLEQSLEDKKLIETLWLILGPRVQELLDEQLETRKQDEEEVAESKS